MLALAVSLLFGSAAIAAVASLCWTLVTATDQAQRILAELADIDRSTAAIRQPARERSLPQSQPALAVA